MLDFASVISRFSTRDLKNGQLRYSSRSSFVSAVANALPQPYQAGRSDRFCVQAKTHGIARRDAKSQALPRRAGREPIWSRGSSGTGVKLRKNSSKPGSSQTSDLYARW